MLSEILFWELSNVKKKTEVLLLFCKQLKIEKFKILSCQDFAICYTHYYITVQVYTPVHWSVHTRYNIPSCLRTLTLVTSLRWQDSIWTIFD